MKSCEKKENNLINKHEMKDLNYYKNNCEEDYIKTPISVLRYITELEKQAPKKQFFIYGVVKWFAIIILCVLINILFILISTSFENVSKGILLFGGWINCLIYIEISKRIF
jgi:hypothetical protein